MHEYEKCPTYSALIPDGITYKISKPGKYVVDYGHYVQSEFAIAYIMIETTGVITIPDIILSDVIMHFRLFITQSCGGMDSLTLESLRTFKMFDPLGVEHQIYNIDYLRTYITGNYLGGPGLEKYKIAGCIIDLIALPKQPTDTYRMFQIVNISLNRIYTA